MEPWILIVILLVIVMIIGLFIAVFLLKGKKDSSQKPDYRSLFILGFIFLASGLSLSLSVDNPAFYGMVALGFIFFIVGLSHRNEWKE